MRAHVSMHVHVYMCVHVYTFAEFQHILSENGAGTIRPIPQDSKVRVWSGPCSFML